MRGMLLALKPEVSVGAGAAGRLEGRDCLLEAAAPDAAAALVLFVVAAAGAALVPLEVG